MHRRGNYAEPSRYLGSLLATISRKPSLQDPRTLASYIYLVLGRAVRESDISQERVRLFLETLSPDEARVLFYSLFSLDSPKLHYQLLKKTQERLGESLRGHSPSFYEAYLFALSVLHRTFYREFAPENPLTLSLLVADFFLLERLLEMGDYDLQSSYEEMSSTMSSISQSLQGHLFYPRKMSTNGKEVWRLVPLDFFLAHAPKEEGDIPGFLSQRGS